MLSLVVLGRLMGEEEPSQSAHAEKCIMHRIKMLEELKLKPDQAEGYLYLGKFYTAMNQREKALKTL
jgi:cytochrome c-type biogenesis protein CcmH/NrfG